MGRMSVSEIWWPRITSDGKLFRDMLITCRDDSAVVHEPGYC
jgi:hypothetical protein